MFGLCGSLGLWDISFSTLLEVNVKMYNFDFGGFFNPYVSEQDSCEVLFEHYVGSQLISQQKQSGNKEFLAISFIDACKRVMEREPTKLILKRWESVYSSYDKENKQIELSIEFKNRNEKEWPE